MSLASHVQAQDAGEAAQSLEQTVVNTERAAPARPAPRRAPSRPAPVSRPAPTPAPVVPVEEPVIVDTLTPDLSNQVTAFKTSTPLIDVPQSVTVFSEERIKDQGFLSIGEIIDYTPGVNNSQGEGHRDAIVFRGQRSTADFYVDGLRDDVQYYRPLYNVEQVEILRGPSALHFGRGGTGGILNRVTKKAIINDKFGNYNFTVDSFGATNSELDFNVPLSSPNTVVSGGEQGYGGKQVALRLNTFYESLENHRDFYDGERFGINPTFAIQFNPDTRLDVSYEYNDHDRFIDRGIPTGNDGRPVERLRGVVFGDRELNFSTLEAHTFRAALNHKFNDTWKGRVAGSYGRFDKVYSNFFADGYDEGTDVVTIDGYRDTTRRENLIFNGDIVGEFETGGIGHKLLVGVEYINTDSDQDRFNSNFNTTDSDKEQFLASNFRLNGGRGVSFGNGPTVSTFSRDSLADDTRVEVETYSVYLQDEISIGNKLDLVGGVRYDNFDIEVFDAETGQFSSQVDSEFSPRAGIIFKPVENISIYGMYSESFLPRSGEQFANLGSNPSLGPDSYSNLEAGIKWDIKDDLALTMAVFELEESSPTPISGGNSVIVDTETTGFELQLNGNITDRWFMSAGYSYLDGEVEQNDPNGYGGNRLRELPENSFSMWNQFVVTDRLGLGLGFVYQDESFTTIRNTSELPSYFRVDAAVYYKLRENLRVQLNIENLFDEQYFPNSHSTHQVTVGRPINAALTISGSF